MISDVERQAVARERIVLIVREIDRRRRFGNDRFSGLGRRAARVRARDRSRVLVVATNARRLLTRLVTVAKHVVILDAELPQRLRNCLRSRRRASDIFFS